MRLALAIAALTACGPSARPAPVDPAVRVAPAPPTIDGAWTWREDKVADGVERSERESWHLNQHGQDVTGYCDRVVSFRSLDGTPFSCSQRPSYTLTTRYHITGTIDGSAVRLAETRHEVAPSPCESGKRGRVRYAGVLGDDTLELRWPTGAQTLARTGDAQPAQPLSVPVGSLDGTWHWQTRTPLRDETEHWHLVESAQGIITGHYERTVTVRPRDGGTLACNGQSAHTLTERYEVRGTRHDQRVTIAELTAEVADSPCELYAGERSLDSARGRVRGTAVELMWRGARRQVLHRTAPAP